MKRISALIVILSLLLALTACGGGRPAVSVGIIGGADGPTAIFVSSGASEHAAAVENASAEEEHLQEQPKGGPELYAETLAQYEAFFADDEAEKTAGTFRPFAEKLVSCADAVPECSEALLRMALDALENIPESGTSRIAPSRREAAELALFCLEAAEGETAGRYAEALRAMKENRPCDAAEVAVALKEQGDETLLRLLREDGRWLEAFADPDRLESALGFNAAKALLRACVFPRREPDAGDFTNRNLLLGPVEMMGNNVFAGYDRSCSSLRLDSYGELLNSLKGCPGGGVLVIHCWQDVPRLEEPRCRADFRTMSFLPDGLFPTDLSGVEYLLEVDYDYHESGTFIINRDGVRESYPSMVLHGGVRVIRLSDGEEIYSSNSIRGTMPTGENYTCGGNYVCGLAPEMGGCILEGVKAVLRDRNK